MARTYRKSKYGETLRDGIQPPRCYDPPCQICFPSKVYNRFLERYKAIQDATYDPEGRCHACAWWVDYHEQGCWADVLTPHCTGCWEPYSYCCCRASEDSNYYGGAVWQSLGDNDSLLSLKWELTIAKPLTKAELRRVRETALKMAIKGNRPIIHVV